eukprot:scaffold26025_cov23-Prasinocladus_malaysianus.AAC.1
MLCVAQVQCPNHGQLTDSILTESLGSVQLRNKLQLDPWHKKRQAGNGPVEDLWVVVKGEPVVQPSKEGLEHFAELDSPEESCGSPDELQLQESPQMASYVAIDHEDVVEAVADFLKERVGSHLGSRSFDPDEVTNAFGLALSDEKDTKWRRIWGNGRLLYRSASAAGGLAKECREKFGPQGPTAQAIRAASSKALTALRLSSSRESQKP